MNKHFLLILVVFAVTWLEACGLCATAAALNISVQSDSLQQLELSKKRPIQVDIMCGSSAEDAYASSGGNYSSVRFKLLDERVARIVGPTAAALNCSPPSHVSVVVTVLGRQLGESTLQLLLVDDHRNTVLHGSLPVTVLHTRTPLNNAFVIVIAVFVFVLTFGFGCRIRLAVVKEIVRRPAAPALGLGCQFLVMPLVSAPSTTSLYMSAS